MKAVERGNDLSTAIVSPVPPDPDLYRQALLVLWGRTCFVNRASFELCWMFCTQINGDPEYFWFGVYSDS